MGARYRRRIHAVEGIAGGVRPAALGHRAEAQNDRLAEHDVKFARKHVEAHGSDNSFVLPDELRHLHVVEALRSHFQNASGHLGLELFAVFNENPPASRLSESLASHVRAVGVASEFYAHALQKTDHVRAGFRPFADGGRHKTPVRLFIEADEVFRGVEWRVGVQNRHEMVVAAAYASAALEFSLVDEQNAPSRLKSRERGSGAGSSGTKDQHVRFMHCESVDVLWHSSSLFSFLKAKIIPKKLFSYFNE